MAESLDSYSDIEDDIDTLTESFNRAADHIKSLVAKLETTTLLELYSYYKQALEGKCNTPRPRFYELQAKSKWDAWNNLGELSKDVAKQKYIDLVSKIDPDFENNEKSESWVAVSCLTNTEEHINDEDKTVFDHVKDSDILNLTSKLTANLKLLNSTDNDGMGLVHWAADRGDLNILKFLVKSGVDIDMIDQEGQTALHYAVSCDHFDCVKFLIEAGANLLIKDESGSLPKDLTDDEKILELLNM